LNTIVKTGEPSIFYTATKPYVLSAIGLYHYCPTAADGAQTICKLEPDAINQNYSITIHTNVSNQEFAAGKKGTVGDGKIICPHCNAKTPVNVIRGDIRTVDGTRYGLRQWQNEDIVPQATDVFKERLYCIRWVETKVVTNKKGEEKEERIIHFT
jgi:hypothetical protein